MFVTARIMDFDLYLAFFDSFDALINIKHCRFIFIRERVFKIVSNKAGLSHRGIADEYYLDQFVLIIICNFNLAFVL